jgi:hypothetical protein
MDKESTGGMVIPPGITSSWAWNPPEERDFAGNYLLIDADSDRKDQNARKTLRTEAIPGLALQLQILYTANVSFFYIKNQIRKHHYYDN